MAHFPLTLFVLQFFISSSFMSSFVISQPPLNSAEQESVYRVLELVNSEYPWRSLFPDDLCSSAPHGVVCEYFSDTLIPHVTELSFGYVSDYSPNPICNSNSTLDPSLFLPLTHLKKLFFYKCFTETKFHFPVFTPFSSSLEELVFIENPALFGSIDGKINNIKTLKKLILTGSFVNGTITNGGFGDLINLEQLTLSRNKFNGEIHMTIFQNMKKLKVLDLSENGFHGNIPESIGNLSKLLKMDLSYNRFSGKIPENFKGLKNLEFLDLSYNHLGHFGVPLFLSEMFSLKELYLSGNLLGGQIPEIWENLGGIIGIGFSGVGLVGNIPKSMGLYLRNVFYLGLDNNMLEGFVPEEFGGLEFLSELNLENNSLSGRIPFSVGFVSKLGERLKLKGNLDLCIDKVMISSNVSGSLQEMKMCKQLYIPKTAILHENSCPRVNASFAVELIVCWVFFVTFLSFS